MQFITYLGVHHKPVARPMFQGRGGLYRRSRVVRSLTAYFILYVMKIKWKMCAQKKLNFLACYGDQGAAQSKFQEISPLLQRTGSKLDCKSIFQRWQKAGALLPRSGICHPTPPPDYGLVPHCKRCCLHQMQWTLAL